MPTYTISATGLGQISSQSSTGSGAQAGGTYQVNNPITTTASFGQAYSGYTVYEGYVDFPSPNIPANETITSATLTSSTNSNGAAAASVAELRLYDWGATLTGASDWQTPSQLTALTPLVASVNFPANNVSGANLTWTVQSPTSINKAAITRFIVASASTRSGTILTAATQNDFVQLAIPMTFTITTTAPISTVTAVSPNNGPTTSGTSVTITGTSFTGATGVTFGGTAATSVVVNSSTSITCLAPAHVAGAVAVVVTTAAGSSSSTLVAGNTYTYVAAPTVTSIAPTSGTSAGGTAVTITGTNLTGATGATIGGAAVTGFTAVSATSVTGTSPAGTVGAQSVTVTTSGGTGTLAGGFTYTAAAATPRRRVGKFTY